MIFFKILLILPQLILLARIAREDAASCRIPSRSLLALAASSCPRILFTPGLWPAGLIWGLLQSVLLLGLLLLSKSLRGRFPLGGGDFKLLFVILPELMPDTLPLFWSLVGGYTLLIYLSWNEERLPLGPAIGGAAWVCLLAEVFHA